MTGGMAASMNVATKTGLDEAPRSARWVTQFVIRSATISHKYTPSDASVYGSIPSEADKSLRRLCGKPTSGTASARAMLRRCSSTVTSLLYWRFTFHYPSPTTSVSPSYQPACHRLHDTIQQKKQKQKQNCIAIYHLLALFSSLFPGYDRAFFIYLGIRYLLLGCGRSCLWTR